MPAHSLGTAHTRADTRADTMQPQMRCYGRAAHYMTMSIGNLCGITVYAKKN